MELILWRLEDVEDGWPSLLEIPKHAAAIPGRHPPIILFDAM
jgi:hypothetical protein